MADDITTPPRFQDHRFHVQALIEAALAAVEPGLALRRHLHLNGELLHVGEAQIPLPSGSRVLIVGAGKAGIAMGRAAEDILGGHLGGGIMAVPSAPPASGSSIQWMEGGHPLPSEGSVRAGEAIADLLASTSEDDLVLVLLSGGGSALLELPAGELSLAQLRQTTEALLRSGARIDEVNTVRQQLSRLKGGGLAALAAPSTIVGLILSDVVGDRLEYIASGPTVATDRNAEDALAILERYRLSGSVPPAVIDHLKGVGDSSKPAATAEINLIIGNNRAASQAALAAARSLGFNSAVLTNLLQGEARQAGVMAVSLARQILQYDEPVASPGCLILGGETTVTVRGDGRGGRNQELALAAAIALDGVPGVAIATVATDGIDGPTPAAGALVTGASARLAREQGLDPEGSLASDDSFTFFSATKANLETGPTGTNVSDLTFILCYRGEPGGERVGVG